MTNGKPRKLTSRRKNVGIGLMRIEDLRVDAGVQQRVALDSATVEAYTEALRDGARFPPLVAFEDLVDPAEGCWLADGFHRFAAYQAAAVAEVEVDLRRGTRRDAILFSVGANADHGLRRSPDDKRRAVLMLLEDPEWSSWSDRAIAEQCRVAHSFVAKVRAKSTGLETSGMRTGRDGRAIDTSAIAEANRARAPEPGAPQLSLELCGAPHPVTGLPCSSAVHSSTTSHGYAEASGRRAWWFDGARMGPFEPPAPPPPVDESYPDEEDARRHNEHVNQQNEAIAEAVTGLTCGVLHPIYGIPCGKPAGHENAHHCAHGLDRYSWDNKPPPPPRPEPVTVRLAGPPLEPEAAGHLAALDEDLEDDDSDEVLIVAGVAVDDRAAPATILPTTPRIDLRCCSVTDVEWPEADLVVADPPWLYEQRYGASEPPYPCLATVYIVEHLARLRARRMALWMTWALMPEWTERTAVYDDWRWKWVTGGAWHKSDGQTGHYGPGHHWAGCSEPVLIYTQWGSGPLHNTHRELRNAWTSEEHNSNQSAVAKRHSSKPVGWMTKWIERWVPEGGLVLDPYAGLGSVAEAVLLAGGGRRYLGTEIDPGRHAEALERITRLDETAVVPR
jgi:hypothetical protein